jgi:uncharacterized pyridoxal phosphate-containing UPF0001 family protein
MDISLQSRIARNIAVVQAEIVAACQRARRSTNEVKLVAISKTHPPEVMLAAVQAGIRHLGENRVEDAAPKIEALISMLPPELPAPTWHMVGHVQSRKAQAVVKTFDIIHSLDSLKLAQR